MWPESKHPVMYPESADRCHSASSLGMMSEEEKKMQRIEDIKDLLS